MNLTTVTTKGQATIPEEIRLALNIQPGDKILYKNPDPAKMEAVIRVIPTKNVVERLAGSLKTRVRFVSREHEREAAGIALGKYYETVTRRQARTLKFKK